MERIAKPQLPTPVAAADQQSLAALIARRQAFLNDYQDAAYGQRYREYVAKAAAQAAKTTGEGDDRLGVAVAEGLFKLMAYKDEYEVARLYTSDEFKRSLTAQFEGDFEMRFHLAPPLFAKRDAKTGHLIKREYGAWVMKAMPTLARLKRLRGTALDIFGYSAERKMERALVDEYRATIENVLAGLTRDNLVLAIEIANLPQRMRGYGHVKERNVAEAREAREALLKNFHDPSLKAAAE